MNDLLNPETHSFSEVQIIEGKTIGIIAYLTVVGLIIAFVMNSEKKNEYAAYHIRQVLGLALTGLALGVVSIIPFLGWFISIIGAVLILIMWISGLMNALNGKAKPMPMPILGKKYEEWLKNV